MWLKADLHTHTADDPTDSPAYSTEMLIDAAAAAGINVLAVTSHGAMSYVPRLAQYAAHRGLLLIPGAELKLEGKHVVLLNPSPAQLAARSLSELYALKGQGELIIAPHPWYPSTTSLRTLLEPNITLFDAIEYCSLHMPGLNFNRRAVRLAKRVGLPLVGSTDTHSLPYMPSTHTLIDAESFTIAGVLDAIRAQRIKLHSRPVPFTRVAAVAWGVLFDTCSRSLGMYGEEAVPS